MAFCAICQRYHDPDIGCFDGSGQILRNMGIEREDKYLPKNRLQKKSSKTKWLVLVFLLSVFIIGIIIALVYVNG